MRTQEKSEPAQNRPEILRVSSDFGKVFHGCLTIFLAILARFLLTNLKCLNNGYPQTGTASPERIWILSLRCWRRTSSGCHLEKLWSDPDALREMLDLKEVFRGLLDSPAAIQVSPRFYFYVLVRHAFLQADLSRRGAGRLRGRSDDQADLPVTGGSAARHRRRLHPCLGLHRHHFQREGADALPPASGGGKPVSGAHRTLSGFHQAPQRDLAAHRIWSSTNPSRSRRSAAPRTTARPREARRGICSARSPKRCPPPAAR